MDLAGVNSASRSPALNVDIAVVVVTLEDVGMNDDDEPRTVWLESADVFLRRTLRLSGDLGGGGGAASANDKLDLVGEVVRAKDDRVADLVGDREGRRSTIGFGGDCSIGWRSE
jgi:hypothetical protein